MKSFIMMMTLAAVTPTVADSILPRVNVKAEAKLVDVEKVEVFEHPGLEFYEVQVTANFENQCFIPRQSEVLVYERATVNTKLRSEFLLLTSVSRNCPLIAKPVSALLSFWREKQPDFLGVPTVPTVMVNDWQPEEDRR